MQLAIYSRKDLVQSCHWAYLQDQHEQVRLSVETFPSFSHQIRCQYNPLCLSTKLIKQGSEKGKENDIKIKAYIQPNK